MVNQVISIIKKFNPISIFIYGSNANDSTNSKSDFEIGVIFKDDAYVQRKDIQSKILDKNYNVFPFKLNEIKQYNIDTPFQKKVYLASLVTGNAKTIYGKKIIENLECPKISNHDLLMDLSFNLGYALSSVRLIKEGINELANEFFYKSMFYATRDLYYAKFGVLINGYNNIYRVSKKLNLPKEFKELLKIGYKLRNEQKVDVDNLFYFRNISYINKYVIPVIEEK